MGSGTNLLIILFSITVFLNFGLDTGSNTGLDIFLESWLDNGENVITAFINSVLTDDILLGTGLVALGTVFSSLLTGGVIISYLVRGVLIGGLTSWFINPLGLIRSLGFADSMTSYVISGFIVLMISITMVSYIGGKDL